MANDQRTIYAHYKYGQPRIGRKKKIKMRSREAEAAEAKLHLLWLPSKPT